MHPQDSTSTTGSIQVIQISPSFPVTIALVKGYIAKLLAEGLGLGGIHKQLCHKVIEASEFEFRNTSGILIPANQQEVKKTITPQNKKNMAFLKPEASMNVIYIYISTYKFGSYYTLICVCLFLCLW